VVRKIFVLENEIEKRVRRWENESRKMISVIESWLSEKRGVKSFFRKYFPKERGVKRFPEILFQNRGV